MVAELSFFIFFDHQTLFDAQKHWKHYGDFFFTWTTLYLIYPIIIFFFLGDLAGKLKFE